jgi:hypothetical protein
MENCIRLLVLSCALLIATPLIYSQQTTFSKVLKDYGGAGVQAYSMVESYDHYYLIAGVKDGDGLILKMNPDGNLIWAHTFNNPDITSFYQIIRTTDSCYMLVGSQFSFSQNNSKIICIKLNQNEDTIWSKSIDAGVNAEPYSIAENDDQGFIVTGNAVSDTYPNYPAIFVARLSSEGELLWFKKIPGDNFASYGYSAKQVPEGGFIVTGITEDNSWNHYAFLLKLFADGSVDWFKKLVTSISAYSDGYDLQVLPDGLLCYFETGYNNGLLIVKTDFSGDIIFSKFYEGIDYYPTYSNMENLKLHPTSDGGFVSITPGQFGNLIKIDSEGNLTKLVKLALIPNDVIETTDKGFIILGNGPLGYWDKEYEPQIGVIRTDSLIEGSECAYPSYFSQITGNVLITDLDTSGTSGGTVASIILEITDVPLNSSEGCVEIIDSEGEIIYNSLKVYPNPGRNHVSVTIPVGSDSGGIVAITDLFGRQVITQRVSGAASVQHLDVTALPAGMYFLHYETESLVMTGKLEVVK